MRGLEAVLLWSADDFKHGIARRVDVGQDLLPNFLHVFLCTRQEPEVRVPLEHPGRRGEVPEAREQQGLALNYLVCDGTVRR